MTKTRQEADVVMRLPGCVRFSVSILYAASVYILIAVVYTGFQYSRAKDRLVEVRAEWTELQPAYVAAQKRQPRIEAKKRMLQELNGWNRCRISAATVLSSVREQLPKNVNLAAVQVWGDLETFSAPQADRGQPQPLAGRDYQLRMCFIGAPTTSSSTIVKFMRALRSSYGISQYFSAVTMGSVDKDMSSQDEELASRIFCIDAQGERRVIVKP